MHIHNTCITFRYLHVLHIMICFYTYPLHLRLPRRCHTNRKPTSQRRHAGPSPSRCGDRSRGTLDGAEEGTSQGEWVIKPWRKPWGKRGKPRFSAFGFWGSSQTKFWINPNTLVNGFVLKVADPKLSVIIPNSPLSVGGTKGFGVLQGISKVTV